MRIVGAIKPAFQKYTLGFTHYWMPLKRKRGSKVENIISQVKERNSSIAGRIYGCGYSGSFSKLNTLIGIGKRFYRSVEVTRKSFIVRKGNIIRCSKELNETLSNSTCNALEYRS